MRVQAAFIAEQAAQCGYCTNGMIMAAQGAALAGRRSRPSDQIKQRARRQPLSMRHAHPHRSRDPARACPERAGESRAGVAMQTT